MHVYTSTDPYAGRCDDCGASETPITVLRFSAITIRLCSVCRGKLSTELNAICDLNIGNPSKRVPKPAKNGKRHKH